MTDIYEQLQTEADVEAEKIRPTKEESSLYGAKWLTVEDLLTDDKGYSKFAVDSAKAGGGSSNFKLAHVALTYTGSNTIRFWCPYYLSDDNNIMLTFPLNAQNPSINVDVVVPVNGQTMFVPSSGNFNLNPVTISGDAVLQNGVVFISGDCEITIGATTAN